MAVSHQEGAARMGYSTPARTPAAKAPAREATKHFEHRSYDRAIASGFDKLEAQARHRNDSERVAELRRQREQLRQVFERRKVDPEDAQRMLAIHLEHVMFPRSSAALKTRWEGPQGYEALRLGAGGKDAAQAEMARADGFYRDVKAIAPSFADEAARNGAASHPDMIRLAAKHGGPIETKEPPK